MKKFVKIPLTLLLSFSLISGITVFSGAVSPSTDDAALKVLNEDFAALSENEFEEITSDSENYDIYVLMQFDYPAIDLASLEGLSVEERRDTVKNYYKTRNEQTASELGISNVSVSYSAPYAEIIYDSVSEYNEDRDTLMNAASNDKIKYVGADFISGSQPAAESTEVNSSAPDFTLDDIFETIGIYAETEYDGTGIKVGILEDDLPVSCANLPSTVYTEEYGVSNTSRKQHAAFVASLIGGTTGVAKGASLYFAACCRDNPNLTQYTFTDCLNWLVHSKYVNIINMSAGYYFHDEYTYIGNTPYDGKLPTNTNGTVYTTICAYIDYTIATSGCLIVKSAGNRGGNLTKPAMAVNALTVGATDANGEVWASSSYISDDENIPKPEVVAPGVNIVVPNLGTNSGTSFATPLVTGIAVRLMHQYPDLLKTNPGLLKEIIMVGCNPLSSVSGRLDDYSGYGMICYTNSRNIIANKRFGTVVTPEYSAAGKVVYESLITVSPMQIIYINLSRMILGQSCTPSADIIDHNMVKYKVRIIYETSAGETVIHETNWNSSTAYINIENRVVNLRTYKIQVVTNEQVRNRPEIISLSHPYEPHVHSYIFNCSPTSNYMHSAQCACKDTIYENHTYVTNSDGTRICTKCNYPEGLLSS